jgi:hypothetical protein
MKLYNSFALDSAVKLKQGKSKFDNINMGMIRSSLDS